MSRVIDSRTVEMTFDNSKFAKNCDDTMKQLDSLDKTLSKTASGADFSAAEKGLSNLGRMASDNSSLIADSLSSLESRFSAWGTFVGRVVEDVADKFVNLATTVGKTLIEASTVGAMKDGLAEYNLLMESMQSMSVLTGESTENINHMFDQLNNYADKTKYSFADMTRNLSMFAASGATLDEMETSMEGIANWMAAVGAPASDMQRIIYNIGQAFSKGYLQLIDWKSIENSKGMNGQQFVERFVENAYRLGKFNDFNGKDLFDRYAEAMEAKAAGNLSGWFREAISGKDGFKGFDKEVMLATFKDFAENPEYIKAATQLKTFSEFLDNVKEEMGSGWQVTWRKVIGDLDQATTLFKGLKDSLLEYWDLGGNARNEFVEDFNDLGGAGQTYSILTNLVKIIGEMKKALKSGWEVNFEEITGLKVYDAALAAATKLRHFLDDMKEGNWLTDGLEIAGDAAGNAVANIMKLGSAIGDLVHVHSEGLGQLAGKIFDIGAALTNRLFNSIGKIADKLTELDHGLLGNIIADIGAIAYAAADLIDTMIGKGFIGKAFNSIWKSLEDGVDTIDIIKSGFSEVGTYIDNARQSVADWAIELAGSTSDGTFMHGFAEVIIAIDANIVKLKNTLGGLKEQWSDCWEAVHEGDWTRFSTFIKQDLIPALEGAFNFDLDSVIEKLQEIAFWRPDFSQFTADLGEIWGSFEFGEDILQNIINLFKALGETLVSFWHRVSSDGLFGSGFTSLKEKLGLDNTQAFKLDWLEDIFSVFKKGSKDVEDATEKITTSVVELKKAFSGPGTETLKMESLSLEPSIDEEQISLWEQIKEKFAGYWEYVKKIDVNEDGIARWLKLFALVGLGKTLRIVANAIKTFADSGSDLVTKFEPWKKIPESINHVLGGITNSLNAYKDKLNAEAFATKWGAIGKVLLVIVAAVAAFGILDHMGVDVMGSAMVVVGLLAMLVVVMEACEKFKAGWEAMDSVALAAACLGFGSMIKNMSVAVVALTVCAELWANMNFTQLAGIFGSMAFFVGSAFATLVAVGKILISGTTSLDFAVIYVILAGVTKMIKSMAVTFGALTLIEKFGGESTNEAMLDLVALWGMVELLTLTVMKSATSSIMTSENLLKGVALMYMVKKMFSTLGLVFAELTLLEKFGGDSTNSAMLDLVAIFGMIEAVLWSVVGMSAVATSGKLLPGMIATETVIDELGDLILRIGIVVAAFSLLNSDRVMEAIGEMGLVLGELVLTLAAFSAINKFLNGGVSLNITGLVAMITSMAAVVAALAIFMAATANNSPDQIMAALDAFEVMIATLGGVFLAMAALAGIATAVQGYGELFLAALGVMAAVWVAVGAGAALAGVGALAFSGAVDLLVEAMAKFVTIDVNAFTEKAAILGQWLAVELPQYLIDGAASFAAALIGIAPKFGVALVGVLTGALVTLNKNLPAFIAAFDAMVVSAVMQITMDISKYGELFLAGIIVDLDEFATLITQADGVMHAMGRIGQALMNTFVASFAGQEFADQLAPVADSFTGELKSALERKIPELNERGHFMVEEINNGIQKGAEEGKYALFNKGKETAESYGQGLLSQNDMLSAFGLSMGTAAGTSLADEEVQSVYRNAAASNANAYGMGFINPDMQALMEQYGIDTAGLLGGENVLGAFGGAGALDMSSYYESLFADNPELKAQLEAAGIDIGSLMSNSAITESFKTSGAEDILAFNQGQEQTLREQSSRMVELSAQQVRTYYSGQTTKTAAKESGATVAEEVAKGMESKKSSMETAGKNLAAGANNGLWREATKKGGIIDRAFGIGGQVVSAIARAWDEHSPSRIADQLGAYFSIGLGNGFVREGNKVVTDAQQIAEDISQSFVNMEGFQDGILTITPTVDLREVEKAARKTSNMFNLNKGMQMDAQFAFAGTDGSAAFGNTYNINVNETDANNGYSVGRDIERYLIRRF